MQQYFEVLREGKHLRGTLHLPENTSQVPCLLLCHGFTGNRNERLLIDAARALEAVGVACARFDCLGSGDSDGMSTDVTVTSEIDDMCTVYDYIHGLQAVASNEIYVGGHSLGGLVALKFAALHPSQVAGLVLISPALTCYHEIIAPLVGERLTAYMNDGIADWGGFVMGRALCDELCDTDSFALAKGLNKPALLLHGTMDKDTPAYISVRLKEIWGEQARLALIENADHCYQGAAFHHALCDALVDFFKRKS